MKTILCYRRKSLVRQESDLISPARQKQAVEGSIAALGDDHRCQWFEDIDGHRSGRTEEGRPGWLDLKRQLGRADVAGVACYSLSRIYRNVREFLCFVDELNHAGLRLIVVKESIDTGTAVGMAINTILMALYQLESDLASERMTETIEYKRRQLGQHWGTVPFGTLRDEDGRLVPDDRDAGTLQQLYEGFATGKYTYDSLCDRMIELDLAYRGRDDEPRPWTRDDVRRTLTLWRIYAGHLTIGSNRDDDEVVTIRDTHEPILDPTLCLKVAAQLSVRRSKFNKKSTSRHLLSGLLHCATCDRELNGTTRDGVRRYRHRGAKGDCPEVWFQAAQLEQDLVNLIAGWGGDELTEAVSERIAAILAGNTEQLSLVEQIQEAEARQRRLIDLYLDGKIARGEYYKQADECDGRIQQLRARQASPEIAGVQEAAERIEELSAGIGEMTMEEQRGELLAAFRKITVHDAEVWSIEPQDWLAPIFDLLPIRPARPPRIAPEPRRRAQRERRGSLVPALL